MKALIIKDLYTLKQMRLFLILMFVFACIPSMNGFAIVYSVMLPITAFSYDEQSKWNNLAKTMPYSEKDIVLSKYILGYIFMACTIVISLISQIIISFVNSEQIIPENYVIVFLTVSISLIVMSVYLPAIFKTGVEKGRTFFVFIFIIIFGIIGGMLGLSFEEETVFSILLSDLTLMTVVGIAVSVIANILSIMLSIKIYKNKIK